MTVPLPLLPVVAAADDPLDEPVDVFVSVELVELVGELDPVVELAVLPEYDAAAA